MADNEQGQNDEPCGEAFYNSIDKSGTQELNIPAMYLRRLKDVNREFQQEDGEKKRPPPGHAAERCGDVISRAPQDRRAPTAPLRCVSDTKGAAGDGGHGAPPSSTAFVCVRVCVCVCVCVLCRVLS